MAESSGKAWKRLLENKDPEQVEQVKAVIEELCSGQRHLFERVPAASTTSPSPEPTEQQPTSS